jgi:hypothetical protein
MLMRKLDVTLAAALLTAAFGTSALAADEPTTGRKALDTAAAVVTNVVPVTSALVAPTCLPGYILCKLSYAGLSLVAAAESMVMSGGADSAQPAAILRRGFSGDWVVTPDDIATRRPPDPYPEVAPPASGGGSGFTPPPL